MTTSKRLAARGSSPDGHGRAAPSCTSRTNPAKTPLADVPPWLRDRFNAERNDLTAEVLKNLDWLGVDRLIPIGGDDTLSYGARLSQEGVPVNAILKTMDGDVPGTEACIGFSTCVSRTIELVNRLRTSAGSHERFLIVEVFGRYAALYVAGTGRGRRRRQKPHPRTARPVGTCVAELLSDDRRRHPSRYAVLLVSEGATLEDGGMVFRGERTDAYGHRRLGALGEWSPRNSKRCRPPITTAKRSGRWSRTSATWSARVSPTTWTPSSRGLWQHGGQPVRARGVRATDGSEAGAFGTAPLEEVTSRKKVVNVARDYDAQRLRPTYANFEGRSVFHITAEEE